MALSERSLYRKIQEILSVARSVKPSSLAELVERTVESPHDMFKTMQYDAGEDEMSLQVSLRVIRSTIKICVYLDLIEAHPDRSGQLTSFGREAARRTRFDSVVSERIRLRMTEGGVRLDKMNQLIAKGLKATPVVLPTAGCLWEGGGAEMSKGRFNTLLTLLTYCGDTESSQSKIYLRIATK